MNMNRRDLFASLTLGGVTMALPDLRRHGAAPPATHEVKPLPFDPTKLTGRPLRALAQGGDFDAWLSVPRVASRPREQQRLHAARNDWASVRHVVVATERVGALRRSGIRRGRARAAWRRALAPLAFARCRTREWRNWQTRWVQVPVGAAPSGQKRNV